MLQQDARLLTVCGPAGVGKTRLAIALTGRLVEAGEARLLRARHRDWFLELAETTSAYLRRGAGPEWSARLDAEQDNLRVALVCSAERSDGLALARLSAALCWYWQLRGLAAEAQHYLERALQVREAPPAIRASVLNGAAVFAYDRGEYARAVTFADEALRLCRRLGDAWGEALALCSLGFVAYFQADYAHAGQLLEASLAIAREVGDRPTVGRALNNLGLVALAQGELEAARKHFEASLAVWRELRSDAAAALALMFLGRIAHEQGRQKRAAALLEESLALARRTRYARAASPALYLRGKVAATQGDGNRATALLLESLAVRQEQGDRRGIAECLEGLALAAHLAGDRRRAARLCVAADALRDEIGAPLPPQARSQHDRLLSSLRAALGPDLDSIRTAAAKLPLASLLADRSAAAAWPGSPARGPRPAPPASLSPREREVAALVARGLTNREIGDALVITRRTAEVHVARILRKLGFRSRAQLAAWAVERNLADSHPG